MLPSIEADTKSAGPDQTAPLGSSLIRAFNVCRTDCHSIIQILDAGPLVYTVSHFSYAPLIKCKITGIINVIYLF